MGLPMGTDDRDLNKRLLAGAYKLIPHFDEGRPQLEAFIRWTAGPAIAGLKPASLVSIPRNLADGSWESWRADICRSLGVSALSLREGKKGILVLFYKPGLLMRRALSGIPGRYLRSLSYPVDSGLSSSLGYLKKQFETSGGAAFRFPHEVGIFLGYPPADVIEFSSGRPSPYACRGYWKVYHHPERAQRAFAYMDASRLKLVGEYYRKQLNHADSGALFTYLGAPAGGISGNWLI
jgi:hypothetical protein